MDLQHPPGIYNTISDGRFLHFLAKVHSWLRTSIVGFEIECMGLFGTAELAPRAFRASRGWEGVLSGVRGGLMSLKVRDTSVAGGDHVIDMGCVHVLNV